jgi:hypothetical protein
MSLPAEALIVTGKKSAEQRIVERQIGGGL